MKLKTVEVEGKTYAEVSPEGFPLYEVEGKIVPVDAAQTASQVTALNAENKRRRSEYEEVKEKLKAFEGIEDPALALKAIKTVSDLDAKTLIDAGKADEVKAAAVRAVEEKLEATITAHTEALEKIQQERDTAMNDLNREVIGGNFARSKFIQDSVIVPPDMLQAQFGSAFKVEDGKPVAYGKDGQPIYSATRPGEIADFDEALEKLVRGYQFKDQILKGAGSTGGGAQPGAGKAGEKTITRAEFDRIPVNQRGAKLADGFTVV